MPTINSFIRFLNVSPRIPAVDIYSDGNLVFSNVAYNELSEYLVVGPEEMHIQVFAAGEDSTPLLDTELNIPASSAITIAIIGTPPDISLLPIFFSVEPANNDEALIRFAHLSPTAPPMDLAEADGTTLFNGVDYTQVTDFETIMPGTYDLQLRLAGEDKLLANEALKVLKRKAYTVYAIGIPEGDPPLEINYYQDQIPFISDQIGKTEFRRNTAFDNKAPHIILVYK